MILDENGEPACWSWPISEIRDPSLELVDLLERHSSLMHGDLTLERRARRLLSGDSRSVFQFVEFHGRRCAVCANEAELLLDHNHWTGLVRGFLCSRCNNSEAGAQLGDSRIFSRYRRHPPAAILEYFESYSPTGAGKIMPHVTQLESKRQRRFEQRRRTRLAQLDVVAEVSTALGALAPARRPANS